MIVSAKEHCNSIKTFVKLMMQLQTSLFRLTRWVTFLKARLKRLL